MDKAQDAVATVADHPLANLIGFKVRRLHNVLTQQWSELAAETGVAETSVESGIIVIVRHRPGIAQKALAQLLGVDASTLSQALTPLIQRGLIRREAAADDRRARRMYLTEAGEAARRRIEGLIELRSARTPGGLDAEDLASLHRILDRMIGIG